MSAYQRMRLDDLSQQQANGVLLSDRDKRMLNYLMEEDRKEWEAQPAPQWLGGDYPDAF